MRYWLVAITLACSLGGAACPALADQVALLSRTPGAPSYMRVFGPADPPYAFWHFCDEYPADCARQRTIEARFEADGARLIQLDGVNRAVNHSVEPVTDLELYGVSDYWTLPVNGKGDCEDYALMKRHMLMAAGWPASALLMTVVLDERNEGHAILTVRTASGDFILDNKTDQIVLWYKTPYHYVMRQSFLDPKSWVALDPAQTTPPVGIAGVGKPGNLP